MYNTYTIRKKSEMKKKLTISIDEDVYRMLHEKIGRGNIARFIERRIRPFIDEESLEESYRRIANDKDIQKLAKEWEEGTISDAYNDDSW